MIFKVEVSVTERCNLRCSYCYNNFKQELLDLTPEQFLEFYSGLHQMMFQAQCAEYCITLFGGEPLLNTKLCKFIIEKCSEDPYCSYIVLISNLLNINSKLVQYLHSHKKVGVSWSFDGIYNESQRGRLKEYLRLKPLVLQVTKSCKVMVTPGSLDFTRNAQFLKEYGLTRIDFTPVYDNIWDTKSLKEFKESLECLNHWYTENPGTKISFYEDLKTQFQNSKNFIRETPCFAGITGVCLGPHGVYPCQRFATNRDTQILDFKEHLEIFKPKVLRKCKNCELYPYCPVGCTYTVLKHGQLDSICTLHKIIFYNAIKFYKYNKEILL